MLPGGGDRHQVRLGAGIREADAVEPEPLAHHSGELGFARMHAADARELPQRGLGGVDHALFAVPEQAGGVVAEQVDVLVPVGIHQHGAVAADERECERLVGEDRARVTAREEPRCVVMAPLALRVPRGERLPLLGNQRSEIREDDRAHAAIVPERRSEIGDSDLDRLQPR